MEYGGEPYSGDQRSFVTLTIRNLFWNFVILQGIVVAALLNISLLFPAALPESHVFVLDSADYIDDLYYYGSNPQEIDENYLRQQWVQTDTDAG